MIRKAAMKAQTGSMATRIARAFAGNFGRIRGNARAILLLEPMWAIPFSMYSVYASLFMRELGLTSQQIGLLASVGMASTILSSGVSGYVTDRLGRRRTTLIFDMACWSASTLAWATAHGFWQFFLAAVLNGLQAVPMTSWTCLLVEDSDPHDRLPIFTALQVITVAASFATPLAGLAIRRYGVVTGTRGLYLFAFISMTTMFLLRNHLTRETRVGHARRSATGSHGFRESLSEHGGALRSMLRHREALTYFLLAAIVWFRDSLTLPFGQLLLVDRLGLPGDILATFPALGAVATLLVSAFVLPALARHEGAGILGGLALSGASTAILLCVPRGSVAGVVVSSVVGAAGAAMFVPALNTGWNNSLSDSGRAQILAMSSTTWGLARLPAGWIGGQLYALAPVSPFYAGLALTVAGMALVSLRAMRTAPHARSPRSERAM
ncbi:MAG: MFS transporter [Bacillota bacterium]